jgi:cytochrome c-type biogenesis protein CcsB
MSRIFAFALAVFLIFTPSQAENIVPSSESFSKLTTLDGGRHKPMDTFAWESIRSLYGKSRFKSADGERIEAIDLLLDIAAAPDAARALKLIRIDYHALKDQLSLERAEKYFSFDQIVDSPVLSDLIEAARTAPEDDASKLNQTVQSLYSRLVLLDELCTGESFRLMPTEDDHPWRSPLELGGAAGQAWQALLLAWNQKDAIAFESSIIALKTEIRKLAADHPTAKSIDLEVQYNRFQPFHKAWMLYFFVTLVSLAAAAIARPILVKIASGLLTLGFLSHSAGLIYLTLITGRAPVSNLFESMVFIVWSMIIMALWYHFTRGRENYLLLIAGVIGTLSMAYALDSTVDISINPLVPVLKSYWLNIHVTVIIFSYGAFAICAGLGHTWLWRAFRQPEDKASLAKIDSIAYRALGIGVITLTAGIILGAVWANESWGRYWGWDPKETWSLITLLFYMALLHGRLNGWLNKRRTAVTYIIGMMVVLMTYFGVNYYLSGLHSYATGSADPFPLKLIIYLLLEAAFITVCLLGIRRQIVAKS